MWVNPVNFRLREFTGEGVRAAAEFQVHWACGGKAATEAYFDLPAVREAIHVARVPLREWTMETDLNYTCSGDDEAASRRNFSDCPIKDYRPIIKSLPGLALAL